jgi:hypothetical protein
MNMKKKFLALSAVALLISTFSFAQGFHFGVKGGANIFKVDGKSFKEEYQWGYNLGAWAEININDKIGIQPEVLWNQTNYRTGNEFEDIYVGGVNNADGKLNYLSIPLLLNLKPAKIITFQIGPQFGILLNQDKTLVDNGAEAFKKGDFSALGGVQLNLGALKVGGRYVIGLTDINDIDDKEKWKNQGFQLYLGIKIL